MNYKYILQQNQVNILGSQSVAVLLSLSVSESISVSSELESMSELSEESASMTTSASIRGAFAGGSAALLVRHL